MTLRELNRTLLQRQLLLTRSRLPVGKAVERLVAMQAQYAPSPYVALWSRVEGFRKEQLTRALAVGSIVKAGALRTTLHVMTRAEYPYLASAHAESVRGRTSHRLEVGMFPEGPLTHRDVEALAAQLLGTDDRWELVFALRPLPSVRTAPLGEWPHTTPSPFVLWREPLPEADESAVRVVRAYLAAYGPATRDDVQQFTGFRFRQIDPALDDLRDLGDGFFDLPRAPRARGDERAPVRFLPAFDSMILAHRDRSRIVPPEYAEAVFNKRNATTKNTFTVDGFVAGAWRLEKRRLVLEPFAPLPARARREVDAEGERLLAWYLHGS